MKRKLHRHDLSQEHDFSANMGKLIPSHIRMVYPGDKIRQRSEFLVRVSPMLAPIVSKVMIKAESFYVAADTVWSSAQEFFSGGQDGTSTKVIPTREIVGPDPVPGSLFNHLGIAPPVGVTTCNVNALPLRVYQSIYNWHYRDQDLNTAATVSTADGPDTTTSITLQSRCWERDRFTSARLEPQRGDDVLIPQGESDFTGDVVRKSNATKGRFYNAGTNTPTTGGTIGAQTGSGDAERQADNTDVAYDPLGSLEFPLDISTAAGTIRELEEAVAISRFRKRLQQADGSYPDYTLATFGVRSPDIELQKPVLLARSSSPLQVSEVLQTAPDDGDTDPTIGVGTTFGHGIGVARGHGYKYNVKRHGYIMTIFSVVPKTMYVQGTDKEFWRSTKEDYFDPDLDEIGEEAILNKEVYASHSAPDATFGYNFRNYSDRSSLHRISGEFATTLNFWHQARSFSSDVALNGTFVTANPTDRIFALGSTVDQLRVKALHDVKALRVMRRIPMRGNL